MRKIICLLGVTVVLAGCAMDQAIVTGFNGDSVNIQTSQFAGEAGKVNALNEAQRLCQMRGFKGAEYASTRPDNYNYLNHNLYICSNSVKSVARSGNYMDQL